MGSIEPDRRRQILEVADRLLRLHGPAKTTMADIAREAGIGVGSVYLEFTCKDAIIEELAAETHHAVLSAMKEAAAPSRESFAGRFRAVMEARFETMLRLADSGTHAAELFHCVRAPVQSAHARFQAAERELLAALFRDAHRAQEFHTDDVDRAASVVLRAYASFSPPWVFSAPRDAMRKSLREMHELVLSGLLSRPKLPRHP